MEVKSTRTAAVQPAQQPKRPQQTAQRETAKPAEVHQTAQAKPPKPVVNTQGQTTGRLLHATA